jgi:23S rRNA pseudouridine1911/1915/1917 synthase
LVELVVAPEENGLRLDLFLRESLPDRSRAQLQKHIDEGAVTIGGAPPKRGAATLVAAGDIVVYVPPPLPILELVPEAIALSILFEDEFLVVVDKPKGLVVHPAAGHATGTLANALLHHFGRERAIGDIRPGIVHRLDRDTTGAIVVAKSVAIHEALAELFSARRVTKEYWAVTTGIPKTKEGTFDTFYGRHPKDRKKFSSKVGSGKRAVTRYRTLEVFKAAALLEVALETGRTHQIRVHFADAGHALAGDTTYGKKSALIDRPALHAKRLAFDHPITRLPIDIEAPVPDDFNALLEALR